MAFPRVPWSGSPCACPPKQAQDLIVYAFYILPHILFLITHTTFAAGIMDGSWLRPWSPVFTLLFRSPAVDGSSVMFSAFHLSGASPYMYVLVSESPLNVWKQG